MNIILAASVIIFVLFSATVFVISFINSNTGDTTSISNIENLKINEAVYASYDGETLYVENRGKNQTKIVDLRFTNEQGVRVESNRTIPIELKNLDRRDPQNIQFTWPDNAWSGQLITQYGNIVQIEDKSKPYITVNGKRILTDIGNISINRVSVALNPSLTSIFVNSTEYVFRSNDGKIDLSIGPNGKCILSINADKKDSTTRRIEIPRPYDSTTIRINGVDIPIKECKLVPKDNVGLEENTNDFTNNPIAVLSSISSNARLVYIDRTGDIWNGRSDGIRMVSMVPYTDIDLSNTRILGLVQDSDDIFKYEIPGVDSIYNNNETVNKNPRDPKWTDRHFVTTITKNKLSVLDDSINRVNPLSSETIPDFPSGYNVHSLVKVKDDIIVFATHSSGKGMLYNMTSRQYDNINKASDAINVFTSLDSLDRIIQQYSIGTPIIMPGGSGFTMTDDDFIISSGLKYHVYDKRGNLKVNNAHIYVEGNSPVEELCQSLPLSRQFISYSEASMFFVQIKPTVSNQWNGYEGGGHLDNRPPGSPIIYKNGHLYDGIPLQNNIAGCFMYGNFIYVLEIIKHNEVKCTKYYKNYNRWDSGGSYTYTYKHSSFDCSDYLTLPTNLRNTYGNVKSTFGGMAFKSPYIYFVTEVFERHNGKNEPAIHINKMHINDFDKSNTQNRKQESFKFFADDHHYKFGGFTTNVRDVAIYDNTIYIYFAGNDWFVLPVSLDVTQYGGITGDDLINMQTQRTDMTRMNNFVYVLDSDNSIISVYYDRPIENNKEGIIKISTKDYLSISNDGTNLLLLATDGKIHKFNPTIPPEIKEFKVTNEILPANKPFDMLINDRVMHQGFTDSDGNIHIDFTGTVYERIVNDQTLGLLRVYDSASALYDPPNEKGVVLDYYNKDIYTDTIIDEDIAYAPIGYAKLPIPANVTFSNFKIVDSNNNTISIKALNRDYTAGDNAYVPIVPKYKTMVFAINEHPVTLRFADLGGITANRLFGGTTNTITEVNNNRFITHLASSTVTAAYMIAPIDDDFAFAITAKVSGELEVTNGLKIFSSRTCEHVVRLPRDPLSTYVQAFVNGEPVMINGVYKPQIAYNDRPVTEHSASNTPWRQLGSISSNVFTDWNTRTTTTITSSMWYADSSLTSRFYYPQRTISDQFQVPAQAGDLIEFIFTNKIHADTQPPEIPNNAPNAGACARGVGTYTIDRIQYSYGTATSRIHHGSIIIGT